MSAVVDASLLVAALSDAGAEGRWAEDVVRAGNPIAPHLALVEATNILCRLELEGRLGRMEAGAAVRDLLLLDLERVPTQGEAVTKGSPGGKHPTGKGAVRSPVFRLAD